MPTITNVLAWIMAVDTDDHEEIYAMFTAVKNIEEAGSFSCTRKTMHNGNQYFVKCLYAGDTLLLASDAARTVFLNNIERKYAGPEWTMETWYDFKCEMEEED